MKKSVAWIGLAVAAAAAFPAAAQETLDLKTLREMTPSAAATAALGQFGAGVTGRFISSPLPPSEFSWLGSVIFYDVPKATGVGICGVNAVRVEFSRVTPIRPGDPPVDDPPMRASRASGEMRFRVTNEVAPSDPENQESYRRTNVACGALQPSETFFFTAEGSSSAARDSVLALNQAIEGAKAPGATPYRLTCKARGRCADARGLVRAIRLEQIEQVRDCLSFSERSRGGYCYEVALLPADTGDRRQWALRLRGEDWRTLSSVALSQWMGPVY